MAFVRTVLGDVSTSELGMVYAHEHLIISGGLGVRENPDLLLDSMEKAVQEINEVRSYGINTFVDMMPIDCGREPEKLVEIAKTTGSHIIAATGFHKPIYYDDLHWTYRYSSEQIADLVADEILVGMDRHSYSGPIVERISAQAGIIKGATDYNRMKKVTEKIFYALVLAQKATGACIATHTEMGTYGLEQVEFLLSQGVPANRIILCHLDRNPDLGYHKAIAETGVFLQYDNISRIKYWPDSIIIELILKMIKTGFEDQILLGTDFALRSYWHAYGGGPGMVYLINKFIPRLKDEGVSKQVIDKFLVSNPGQALSLQIS